MKLQNVIISKKLCLIQEWNKFNISVLFVAHYCIKIGPHSKIIKPLEWQKIKKNIIKPCQRSSKLDRKWRLNWSCSFCWCSPFRKFWNPPRNRNIQYVEQIKTFLTQFLISIQFLYKRIINFPCNNLSFFMWPVILTWQGGRLTVWGYCSWSVARLRANPYTSEVFVECRRVL